MMANPAEILERLHERATRDVNAPVVSRNEIQTRIDYVARCPSNRAGVRLLMACLLAKVANPWVDPRQPYTEIGGEQCFSGRTLDEQYIASFSTSIPSLTNCFFE